MGGREISSLVREAAAQAIVESAGGERTLGSAPSVCSCPGNPVLWAPGGGKHRELLLELGVDTGNSTSKQQIQLQLCFLIFNAS